MELYIYHVKNYAGELDYFEKAFSFHCSLILGVTRLTPSMPTWPGAVVRL